MLRIGVIGQKSVWNLLSSSQETDAHFLWILFDQETTMAYTPMQPDGFLWNEKDFFGAVDAIHLLPHVPNSYNWALKSLKNSKHLILEDRLSTESKELRIIEKLSQEAQVIVLNLYNLNHSPLYKQVQLLLDSPYFIEVDVKYPNVQWDSNHSLIYSAFLTQLELVHPWINSSIRRISTTGKKHFGSLRRFISVRLEYENACVVQFKLGNIGFQEQNSVLILQEEIGIEVDQLAGRIQTQPLEIKNEGESPKSQLVAPAQMTFPKTWNLLLQNIQNSEVSSKMDLHIDCLEITETILNKLKLTDPQLSI
ncbi:MAG: hypothetical protein ACJAY8_000389 [Sphingobacteriales bacterium]|jgi:hypothetical protein